ncbi:MAG: AAA family ATPase [Chloroflexi bacterium]|nr:AAA family ATPase [Chloroflexota bacterium]
MAAQVSPSNSSTFHQELVEQFLRPEAYPERPTSVSVLQTHVSSLFFAGDYVYKVKRPVNYGFLDYSTLARRKRFCGLEVTLNRRMAPDVYLGVVEIRRAEGKLFVAEGDAKDGEVVDYAVKMRRLPADRSLGALLKAGRVTPDDARHIGRLIATFHAKARRSAAIARQGSVGAVRRTLLENFRQTRKYVDAVVSRDLYDDVVAYSLAFLETRSDVLTRRGQEGRVVEGHGDLKASDIYIIDGQVKILDCIEFNRRFRCVDAASDIAFLAMDLEFHGHRDLSQAFINAYVETSGDREAAELLPFFKCYRAYVRAKVNSFRLGDAHLAAQERETALDTAQAYYHLAHSYTQVFPHPSAVLVCGLMGTGKTTIAAELARHWEGVHISSDVTRKALAGLAPTEHRYGAYEEGLYAPDMTRRTYDAMLKEAKEALRQGRLVVLDATYRAAEERRQAARAAEEWGVPLWVVECIAPEGVVRRRVLQRTATGDSASDARWELYPRQKAEWEPVWEAAAGRHVALDTRGALDKTMGRLLRELFTRAIGEQGGEEAS